MTQEKPFLLCLVSFHYQQLKIERLLVRWDVNTIVDHGTQHNEKSYASTSLRKYRQVVFVAIIFIRLILPQFLGDMASIQEKSTANLSKVFSRDILFCSTSFIFVNLVVYDWFEPEDSNQYKLCLTKKQYDLLKTFVSPIGSFGSRLEYRLSLFFCCTRFKW